VLSFDSGSSGSTVNGVAAQTRVMDLTDTEAANVCTWLAGLANQPLNPDVSPDLVPGYVTSNNGFSSSCNWVYLLYGGEPGYDAGPPAAGLLSLNLLQRQSDCVANLRQGPCEGKVSDLEDCVNFFVSANGNPQTGALPQPQTCDAYHSACAAFATAPGCTQTVVQSSAPTSDASSDRVHATSLPTVAGAKWVWPQPQP
jgi:hypothetical protein